MADLTANELKADRSFVSGVHRRPPNQVILKAIEPLGHALEVTVIAEDVDICEGAASLAAATRIRYALGYQFAKPVPLDDFAVSRTSYASGARKVRRAYLARCAPAALVTDDELVVAKAHPADTALTRSLCLAKSIFNSFCSLGMKCTIGFIVSINSTALTQLIAHMRRSQKFELYDTI